MFFCAKNLKKQEILRKTRFFKFAPERWSTVLFPKMSFFSLKTSKLKKQCFLQNVAAIFLLFLAFSAQKMLKMTISTSVLSAQHPNAGQNIQQLQVIK